MTEWNRLFWLFFRFSGRINRAVFVLGFLLMTILVTFPLYRFTLILVDSGAAQATTPEELLTMLMRNGAYGAAAQGWSMMFLIATLVMSWSQVAFSVKRLHDLGRSGLFAVALFIPLVQLVALVILCIMPGNAGPNIYGRQANEPSGNV